MTGDHDQPYAPMPVLPQQQSFQRLVSDAVMDQMAVEWGRRDRDAAQTFCLGLVAALEVAGRVTVVGNPVRCLMPPDPSPFPRFRPLRWLP